MRKKGIAANVTCVNAAMHGFAKRHEWGRAVELLGAMKADYGVDPDAVGALDKFVIDVIRFNWLSHMLPIGLYTPIPLVVAREIQWSRKRYSARKTDAVIAKEAYWSNKGTMVTKELYVAVAKEVHKVYRHLEDPTKDGHLHTRGEINQARKCCIRK